MQIFINNKEIGKISTNKYDEITEFIAGKTLLRTDEFYLEQNGRRLSHTEQHVDNQSKVHCILRICGGKGGFGSMLRAIGAQIEKTTNREACRDLSGRRLRDINEEKRLKAWLEKEAEREREAELRKKRKIEKLLAVPKHEFKDAKYEEARSKLSEKVSDSVEEGFKKADAKKWNDNGDKSGLKRKATEAGKKIDAKKNKTALWIGDDISGTDDSDNDSSEDENSKISSAAKECGEKTKSFATENTSKSTSSPSSEDDDKPRCSKSIKK